MARYEETVEVDACAADVWAVMSDVARWSDWTPTVRETTALDEGPLSVGARFRVRQPRLPVSTWTVTELVPGSRFAWRAAAPGVRSRGDHRVEPLGAHSRVVLVFEQAGPLAPVSALLLSGLIGRYVRTEAACLKAVVEGRAADVS